MITLYSTGCDKCNILKEKMDAKHIAYIEVNDKQEIMNKGLLSVPWLEVDGTMMGFGEANNWINAQ